MGKLFKFHAALRITIKMFCGLGVVLSAVIRFCKPDRKTGEFAAVVGNAVEVMVFYKRIEGKIDVFGWRRFWTFVTFAGGREAAKVYIWAEGAG